MLKAGKLGLGGQNSILVPMDPKEAKEFTHVEFSNESTGERFTGRILNCAEVELKSTNSLKINDKVYYKANHPERDNFAKVLGYPTWEEFFDKEHFNIFRAKKSVFYNPTTYHWRGTIIQF